MIHEITAAFFRPGGPYLYVRLVTAAYALSAIGRLIPVKRKQVPGYRPRVLAIVRARGTSRHRAQPGKGGRRRLPVDPARSLRASSVAERQNARLRSERQAYR